jgi:hypothetical protein
MRLTPLLLAPSLLWAQALRVEAPERTMPAWVEQKLSPSDKTLFSKLMRAGIETMWSELVSEVYPNCFINDLNPLHANRRMVCRARTMRYLPNRKDLREKIYAAGPQLNNQPKRRSLETCWSLTRRQTKSAVTGGVSRRDFTRDGYRRRRARDIPEFEATPIQARAAAMRRRYPQ